MDWGLSSSSKLMVMRSDSSSLNNATVFYPSLAGMDEHVNFHESVLFGGFEEDGLEVEVTSNVDGSNAKKRRLSVEQVRSLEMSFEVDNKLEPEKKKQLAHELGLQPRQVAVWFQNRRARWKTKQLETDYGTLKAKYDSIILENKKLYTEVGNLRAKLKANDEQGAHKGMDNDDALSVKVEQTVYQVLDDDVVNKDLIPKSKKEGSICSDGYTSEILDGDPIAVVEENALPREQVPLVIDVATRCFRDEPNGIIYDPYSNQLVAYKLEDWTCTESFTGNNSTYFLPDEHTIPYTWWN